MSFSKIAGSMLLPILVPIGLTEKIVGAESSAITMTIWKQPSAYVRYFISFAVPPTLCDSTTGVA